MALHFDTQAMVNDFKENLNNALQARLNAWEQNTKKFMTTEIAEKFDAEVKASSGIIFNKVIAYLEANPAALADTFGTGSLIDESNPYLQEYFSSGLINPLRKDKRIYGRPAGEYINVLDLHGKPRTSKGKYAGVPIEHIAKPSKPTHAIQQEFELFYTTNVPEAIREAVKKLKLSKYITEENIK